MIKGTDLKGKTNVVNTKPSTAVSAGETDLFDGDLLSISPPDGTDNDAISPFSDDILDLIIGANRELDFTRLGLRRLGRCWACRALLLDVGLRHDCTI
jgi:hypothetical protein